MNNTRPASQSMESFMRTATMFHIDENLEQEFQESVESSVKELQTELLGITTESGLKEYIRANTDSLDRITSLLNVSEEKFKRIVSMLRIQKGYVPSGEWSTLAIRNKMLDDPEWMDEICGLLMQGSSMEKYREIIPQFYLSNFSIDAVTVGRLASEDDIRRLIKKSIEGRYNNKIGDSFFNAAAEKITRICDREGLTYAIKKNVSLVDRAVSLVIEDVTHPRILVDITYGITTSSKQTDYAKKAEVVSRILREKNRGEPDKDRIVYVNVVDGAGWIARQSDLSKIHRCSDYLLNFKTLDVFEDIISYFL